MKRPRRGGGRAIKTATWRRILAAVCLLGLSGTARSQPVPSLREREAQRLAEAGIAALARGSGGDAVQSLERAFQIEPSAVLLEPLGRAAQALRQPLRAADLFQRFLVQAPAELAQSRRAELQPLIDAAQAEACTLPVSGDVGVILRVDDYIVGALPLGSPLLLPCGTRRVRADLGTKHQELTLTLVAERPLLVQFDFKEGMPPLSERPPAALLDAEALDSQIRPRIESAIAAALPEEHVVLLSQRIRETTQARQQRLRSCPTPLQCQLDLARQLDAQFTLELSPVRTDLWRLRVIDTELADVLGSIDIACQSCSEADLAGRLAPAARQLVREALGRLRGTLVLDSQPAHAALSVNAQPRGQTPARIAVLSGPNRIELRKDGFLPVQQTADVPPGQTVTLALTLRVDPAVVRRRISAAKWALFGVGAAALVAGAVLSGLDGQGFCGVGTACPSVWDGVAGVAPLVVGGLAWGGAAALWGVERRQNRLEPLAQ